MWKRRPLRPTRCCVNSAFLFEVSRTQKAVMPIGMAKTRSTRAAIERSSARRVRDMLQALAGGVPRQISNISEWFCLHGREPRHEQSIIMVPEVREFIPRGTSLCLTVQLHY